MLNFLTWLDERLEEGSTWAGVSMLFGLLHLNVSSDLMTSISSAGMAIGAALAIYLKDKKHV